jgi:hydroxypyruvate isomerase
MGELSLDVVIPPVLGGDVIEGIEQCGDLGVGGVEYYDLAGSDTAAVRSAAEEHDVEIVGVVADGAGANGGNLDGASMTDPADREQAIEDIERSLELAGAVEASSLIVTVGPDQPGLSDRTQRGAIIDVLRTVAPTAQSVGVQILLEPLNAAVDHTGYFLTEADEAFEIVERVDSDAVRVVYDIYHQQVTEGNVIETIETDASLIGHVHFADVPGRHEPGTGELAMDRIFSALTATSYEGYVGLECRPTTDGSGAIEAAQAVLPSHSNR